MMTICILKDSCRLYEIRLLRLVEITFLVKKIERTRNLFDDLACLSLGEVNSFLNSVQQLAAVDLLKH